eukprot:s1323_g5.t1
MFPNKVFKDFAKPAVSPVCILQDVATAKVVEVDESDCSITLDTTPNFWPGELVCNSGPFVPIVSCEDKLWLNSVDGFVVGQTVRQERFIGQLEEMFSRFQSEWQSRWDRHLNTPCEQWDPLISFFQLAAPPGPEQTYEPITEAKWLHALKKKKATAAQGPDGWTRQDLLSLPSDLTAAILHVLHQVEAGRMQWPRQWLVGLVHSLEKYEQPAAVTGYRPITIFSLIYRTWASIRSKELLQHLLPQVSSYSYGNVPHRCTTNMWMTLQQEIESNFANGVATNGAVLDIVKCFNHLPRLPIFGVLRHLGAAAPVLHAWSLALSSMERRFSIRGSVGQALRSTTGCAEGDSLSVVGMVAVNELLSQWMIRKAPLTKLISFVDNLELFSCDPHALIRSTQTLEQALDLLDLQVDKAKTYLWSTEGSFRKIFLQHGYNVKTAARDVGAHVQYNRVATNFTITQKIDSFKDRWKSLALSPAVYDQKLRAAKVVAWPNMMHGIASAHLGDPWYEDMRTALMRSLGEHKPGCSPPIHLSLCEFPSADPGFYALWTTVTQCRHYMTADQCEPQFARLASQTHRKRPEVGPCSVVMHRLSKIFWRWDPAGFFRDEKGVPVDLWETPIQELAMRIAESWRHKIACEGSMRHTFVGLAECDAGFTNENLPGHPRDRAIMRSAMNGTFFTADHLKHREAPGDTRCRFCLQPDSLFHRNWECEALATCRKHLSPEQQQALQAMPPATSLQGWFPLPPAIVEFRQRLSDLPGFQQCLILQETPSQPSPNGPVHYFTDGSCLHPKDKYARLCGWGVTCSRSPDMWNFVPVASGCLPGRHQTIVRAEFTAATAAVFAAAQAGHEFCLWSDNQRVVSVLQQLVNDPLKVWSGRTSNHDVINCLASEFRPVSHLCRGIFKVSSHQQITAATTAAERWCFQGNDSADALAARAFQAEPALMECWTKLCGDLDAMRKLRDGMHKMLLAIGVECLTNPAKQSQPKSTNHKTKVVQLTMKEWMLPEDLPPAAHQYILPETEAMLSWIRELHDTTRPVQRWSWWQLFLDAWLNIPSFGPWYHTKQKQWKGGASQPPESFQRRARWFSQYITKISKACQLDLPLEYALPNGSAIAFWTRTLPIRALPSRTEALDEWFGQHLPCISKTADLKQINM